MVVVVICFRLFLFLLDHIFQANWLSSEDVHISLAPHKRLKSANSDLAPIFGAGHAARDKQLDFRVSNCYNLVVC